MKNAIIFFVLGLITFASHAQVSQRWVQAPQQSYVAAANDKIQSRTVVVVPVKTVRPVSGSNYVAAFETGFIVEDSTKTVNASAASAARYHAASYR